MIAALLPEFLRPQWLWALLALPLPAAAWWALQRRANVWRSAVDPHLLPHLVEAGVRGRQWPGLVAALLAWSLAVCALAGPSWRSGGQPLVEGGQPLVIALDLSSEMLAPDLPPSRLAQAREMLRGWLARHSAGEVGLLVFADDAFTVAPLTSDAANVALFLDALSPEVMPVDGHRPDRAIDLAAALLRQAGRTGGAIVLMTGRGGPAAERAAARALAEGYRVSTIGVGTAAGAAFRDRSGGIGQARLDAGALQAIAGAGGGGYAALPRDPAAIDSVLAPATFASAARGGAGAEGRAALDEGYWLLLPLMLLAVFAFRRGVALASLLVCLLLPWQAPAQAQEGGLWQRPDQARHARLREGVEAFRSERYEEAARVWSGLPGAVAAYNAGNALAKAGRLQQALAAYDEALRISPGMEDAIANRRAVEAALKRRPPGDGDGQRKPGDRHEQDGEGQPRDGESPLRPGDGGQDQERPPEDSADRAGGEPPQDRQRDQEPGDGQAQRDADQAQRQRMEQALQQQPGQAQGGSQEDVQAPEPGIAERERRQAGDAWLQRIPDDPGALLRARFKLEHERRNGRGAQR